jgi:hypothetical protein
LSNTVTILQSVEYKDIRQDGAWIQLKYKIQTPYTFTPQVVPVYIAVNTPASLISNPFTIYFDTLVINQYDYINNIYKKDPTKNNLLIQRSFDGSFIGGLQQFRLYDNCLMPTEIYHNFKVDNIRYNILSNRGGRIIR